MEEINPGHGRCVHFQNVCFCREIASAIKRLLDAVNRVIAEVPAADNGSKQVRGHFLWGKKRSDLNCLLLLMLKTSSLIYLLTLCLSSPLSYWIIWANTSINIHLFWYWVIALFTDFVVVHTTETHGKLLLHPMPRPLCLCTPSISLCLQILAICEQCPTLLLLRYISSTIAFCDFWLATL